VSFHFFFEFFFFLGLVSFLFNFFFNWFHFFCLHFIGRQPYIEKEAAAVVRQMLKVAAQGHLHGLAHRDMKLHWNI
jgi:serine/threonine protein kinase